jgi:transcriptional regulator with XRE-family HTH domain
MAKVKSRLKETGPRHFIREWRKFRGLTLEQLAERIGVTAGALSQLERGVVNYTEPMLEALAEELQTIPGALISWPPEKDGSKAPTAVRTPLHKMADEMSPEDAERVVQMARIMLRTGTNG